MKNIVTFNSGLEKLKQAINEELKNGKFDFNLPLQYPLEFETNLRLSSFISIGNLLNAPAEPFIIIATSIEYFRISNLIHYFLDKGHADPESMSADVLRGDYSFARSAVIAANAKSSKVNSLFAEAMSKFTANDFQLNHWIENNTLVPVDEYIESIESGIASLFQAGAGAIAIVNKSDKKTIQYMKKYGLALGSAYIVGSEFYNYELGEIDFEISINNYLGGKRYSVPLLLFLNRSDEKRLIDKFLTNKTISQEEKKIVLKFLNQDSITSYCISLLNGHIDNALDALTRFPNDPSKAELVYLANNLTIPT